MICTIGVEALIKEGAGRSSTSPVTTNATAAAARISKGMRVRSIAPTLLAWNRARKIEPASRHRDHDVGMTAVKVAGFGKGVNVTLGLPFPRTAPDHGPALDIAGKGIADPGSMRAALELAVELARRQVAEH